MFALLIAFIVINVFAEKKRRPFQTFSNPIRQHGADPWVIQFNNSYYYSYSDGGSLFIAKFPNLPDMESTQSKVVFHWIPPQGTPYSKDLWAPELHYQFGNWHLYFAADDGKNENHKMYALVGGPTSPEEPWAQTPVELNLPDHKWAIDGTVINSDPDHAFFVWSGWPGDSNVVQNLYIASMLNGTIIDYGRGRTLISTPTYPWEKIGNPLINEGPEALYAPDGTVYVTYSASGSWTDDYCLGILELTNKADPMNAASWVKHPDPIFKKTNKVWGPGHASFVASPSGKENWIVYHSARAQGSGWDRQVMTQKFEWQGNGHWPVFGDPIPPGVQQEYPN